MIKENKKLTIALTTQNKKLQKGDVATLTQKNEDLKTKVNQNDSNINNKVDSLEQRIDSLEQRIEALGG